MKDSLKERLAELEDLFELQQKADARAIKLWREQDPDDRKLKLPDRKDQFLWLCNEVERASEYLGSLLKAHYPEIHLLDDLYGLCMQVDNGLSVGLTQAKVENARLSELCAEAYELIRYEPSEPEEADLAQRLKQAMKPEESR